MIRKRAKCGQTFLPSRAISEFRHVVSYNNYILCFFYERWPQAYHRTFGQNNRLIQDNYITNYDYIMIKLKMCLKKKNVNLYL